MQTIGYGNPSQATEIWWVSKCVTKIRKLVCELMRGGGKLKKDDFFRINWSFLLGILLDIRIADTGSRDVSAICCGQERGASDM